MSTYKTVEIEVDSEGGTNISICLFILFMGSFSEQKSVILMITIYQFLILQITFLVSWLRNLCFTLNHKDFLLCFCRFIVLRFTLCREVFTLRTDVFTLCTDVSSILSSFLYIKCEVQVEVLGGGCFLFFWPVGIQLFQHNSLKQLSSGHLVAESVKHLTLAFGSGRDLGFGSSRPTWGSVLTLQSLPQILCFPPPLIYLLNKQTNK